MKKYLVITPWCPYPPHKNGGIHTMYNILLNHPKDISIDLFYYSEKDDFAENHITMICKKITHKKLFIAPNIFSRLRAFISGTPGPLAWVSNFDAIPEINYDDYDVVILDQIQSLVFAKYIPSHVNVISMMHDNHILIYRRRRAKVRNPLKKLYFFCQCLFLKGFEKKIFPKMNKIVYVSEYDASLSRRMYPKFNTRFTNIVLGVNKQNIPISKKTPHTLVFSGIMNYPPNEDAALFFAKEVFPKIKEKYSDTIFSIVGKNPTNKILALKNVDGITVTGFVDDIGKEISKSAIYVSPLRFGAGMKNKVLEAMAVGLPVIASSVSREGITGLSDYNNCIFADESNWTEKVIQLMQEDSLREKVAHNGNQYVLKHHSWENVFDAFLV